jgi:hypothetical protein
VKRTYSKTTYQPFDPRRPHQQQDLSQASHRERQIRYHEAMERDYADRQNPTLYEIPDDSTPRGNATEQDEIIEPTLPELEDSIVQDIPSSPPQQPLQNKGKGRALLDSYAASLEDGRGTTGVSRSGRTHGAKWRDVDILEHL